MCNALEQWIAKSKGVPMIRCRSVSLRSPYAVQEAVQLPGNLIDKPQMFI